MNASSKRTLLSALALMAFLSCSSDTTSDDSTDNGTGGETPGTGTPSVVDFGLPLANEDDGVVRAFPGAEGGGMYTTGGRGGKVYHVTKLTDDGSEGTLRHAVGQSGARTIVFDVAGTIALSKELEIKKGDLTIAGQTAPGDGICLRDFPVTIKADNVIIRYLRFRLGDANVSDGDDTIWGRYQQNIILDHCSMSWCVDECASFYANRNFTMQWCLLGESLHNSGHTKGSHGYGGIWGGAPASFHHNLLAHHDSRNPRFDEPNAYDFTGLISGVSGTNTGASGFSNDDRMIDFRNNVVYNFCNYPAYGGEGARINFVGNYYKWGPASVNGLGKTISTSGKEGTDTGHRREYFYQVDCAYTTGGVTYDAGPTQVYYRDNTLDTSVSDASKGAAVTADNSLGFTTKNASKSGLGDAGYPTTPFAIAADGRSCRVTEHAAAEALELTLLYAGASLSRDAVDKRLADDVKNGKANVMEGSNGSKNGVIDRPSDTTTASQAFGEVASDGYPVLTATDEEIARASTDSDGDGIPDYYEELFGLDKDNPADGKTKTLDPKGLYTNLEVYLHYLVRDITAAQVKNGTYTELK
ncbi:pectate lyase [uncultured Alistipes sp.]|uniref:pectate lyase family protein n=1 Tax=uncultured Alistipes sp. TaxID=538949 RepID=UPI00320A6067